MDMLETLGMRQQALLRQLLDHKAGQTIDELAAKLDITRNAVRQHLTGLERDRLVESNGTRPSGGRPQQLYVLSDRGRELFPRHYAWFAQLLIEALCEDAGAEVLGDRLEALGRRIGAQLRETDVRGAAGATLASTLPRLVAHMADLGYGARAAEPAEAAPGIVASNCIFHHLAERYPQVCRFDLGLMGAYTRSTVEHRECMVRGGGHCRFGLVAAADGSATSALPASP
jgi:predicted ArsR family transcriptional regulator